MLYPALLQAVLLLCLIQQTLQGGIKPQSMSWGRILPARGVGIGAKGGGALGSRYANKPLKAGIGHYPVTSPLGVGGYRPLGLGGVPARLPGGYGNHGVYGAGLGTGLPLGLGPANGLGLGHGGKRAYGVGPLPGYGPLAGIGYPAVKPGFIGSPGNYLGSGLVPGAYGPALGQGAYLGAGGKHGAPAALGQGGYTKGPAGVSTGYGSSAAGYLGGLSGNGYGYGNGYGNPYGAALSTGGYAGQPQVPYGGLGAGLDPAGGKYGGAAEAQGPYAGTPVAPARLEGDGGYPYAAQPLGLSGDGSKSSSKHGAAYGAPQAGYVPQLGASQDVLGEQASKYGAGTGPLAGGYKG
ncbi:uncharacterized protein LOC129171167 isoform X5 [Dunckerocampus dactyliophorus]|uniref:uncharacterized protein LOC129171167 isoform X5 n=1 Tax=Dunckerocampus dactyliophorus TaxID=161453 RepID=UPI0024066E97|nr:uncharacterized protein LOC129171167 isoform X5 [Dunckerocampus dactyliophorus]